MDEELHEYKATVCVFSESLSLDELMQRLGEPTRSHDKGDPVTHRTLDAPLRKQAFWSLESTLDPRAPLDEHVEQILDAIDARRAALDAIQDTSNVHVSCAIFSGQDAQAGFAFEPDLSRRLADLALPVIFDIY